MVLLSVFCFANSMTSLVIAMPLDAPRYLHSSWSLNLTSPALRIMDSASRVVCCSSSTRASSASSACTLFCRWITYVLGIFLPLTVSKYSHSLLFLSHGPQRGSPASHLVFLWTLDDTQLLIPDTKQAGGITESRLTCRHRTQAVRVWNFVALAAPSPLWLSLLVAACSFCGLEPNAIQQEPWLSYWACISSYCRTINVLICTYRAVRIPTGKSCRHERDT